MHYNLAIFDLDGTLLDTLEDLTNSVNYALSYYNYPQRTLDEIRSFVGNGIPLLMKRAVPQDTSQKAINQVHEAFTNHYRKNCANHTKPYDGIIELLHTLLSSGCKTAVVSNKADYAVEILCKQYFPGLFSITVGEKSGIAKKPAPDMVNYVLNNLDTPRESAVYIGDSDVDIQTASNASMDSILVDWGFRSKDTLIKQGAEIIVSTPLEILNLIIK